MSVLIDRFTPEAKYKGKWVQVDRSPLGHGRCVARLDDGVLVRYIDIPDVRHHEVLVPFGTLRLTRIPLGARAWLPTGTFGWVAAEVTGWTGFDEYRVKVSGHARELQVPSSKLVLRWNRPLSAPAIALENGFCDTPEYYDARSAFLDELVRQRRVGRGLTAVLSACVDLFQHQIDTVARILGDPVMRYLLADEVGLGKTIEAGLVVRQVLLDDPAASAVVIVPTELREQWEAELRTRLLLSDWIREKRLTVLTHPEAVANALPPGVDIVVVDEAHQFLPLLEFRAFLHSQLLAAPSLLLLSATPMRGDLNAFQRLLHLVDPTAFPLTQPEAFAARVDEREQEASALELLASSRATARQKKQVLQRLLVNHPTDETVRALVEQCQREVDEQKLGPATAQLTGYVRETYRISRRMIRHRRSTGPARAYPVAGRTPVNVVVDDPARVVIDGFLDRLWLQSRDHLKPADFADLLDQAMAGSSKLLSFLQGELETTSRLLMQEQDRALAEATSERLRFLRSNARFDAAAATAERYISKGDRVVVMSSSTHVAAEFAAFLEARTSGRVLTHLSGMPQEEVEEAMDVFLDRGESATVLVGDRSLEEGRNLQDALALINLDLPLDINRLEQRIGRLDRFATRQTPAEVVVLIEPASPWVSGYVRLLDDGIGIFRESAATLQRKLALLSDSLIDDLARRGVDAFDVDLDALKEEVLYEREEVDLLEEVESVASSVDFDDAALLELEEYEADTSSLRQAFERLTSRRGGIGLPTRDNERRGTFVLDDGKKQRPSNLSTSDYELLAPLLKRERAFDRSAAVSLEGVAPLRLGDPLVEWLDQFLRHDERGRARAWVRVTAGLRVPRVWFGSDFLVEFDPRHLSTEQSSASRRLRRRGDALLPPMVFRTWTDASGPAPEDVVREHLARPFDERDDQLLRGSSVWAELLEAVPDWPQLCRMSAVVAHDEVTRSSEYTARVARAVDRSKAEAQRRLEVLRARALRLPTDAERRGASAEMDREAELMEALSKGVAAPSIVPVAAAAVVLWPESE